LKAVLKKLAPCLARRVGQQEAGERVGEIRLIEQRSDLSGYIASDFGIRVSDIVHDFGPTIDHGYDVLEVVARPHVMAAASMKRFQLGGHEQGWRDHSRCVSSDVECVSRFDRCRVPAVAEAQDILIHWHDIDHQIVTAPSAERCLRR
jgi:hypothetical protein